ncbi:UDP-N-acetylhexosamine pyrophosphorylase-like isoform X3 [Mytilus edulis]|uniref:UDP-N-acetylhexosamine pyrophosphorylase-like isoform X3 n=1 Tax=Mytilus edulis TaxID=6550 RepID=UPI0039EDF795
MDINGLRTTLTENGQEHLLKYWDQLADDEKQQLHNDLVKLNYSEINKYFKAAMETLNSASQKIDDSLEPLPAEVCGRITSTDKDTLNSYQTAGLEEVGHNRVAVLLLAGGQGTRLGVPYPKGMYNVDLPSGKTLYNLQAERILKLQRMAQKQTGNSCVVPWYIMTSEHTKQATVDFFEKHNYFGLQKENVILFEQGRLPCMDFEGKIILEKPYKVALAPDGNGGLYKGLVHHGIVENMESRGIKHIHVYCVDNILVKMADPVFIGFCMAKGARCGAKAVEKTVPTEAVGVVCKVEGNYQVVEYSEITLKTAEKRNQDGRLTFNAGNICNHYFQLDFLKHVSAQAQEEQLAHHVAKKKIPYVGENLETIKPSSPNGIKMEKFVFDVFHFARDRNFAVWEVLREDEFSPLKNANTEPKDTPTTARHALLDMHRRFVLGAGGKFVHSDGSEIPDIQSAKKGNGSGDNQKDADEENGIVCEISPLVSYAGEGLEDLVKGKSFVSPLYLEQGPSDEKPVVRQGERS